MDSCDTTVKVAEFCRSSIAQSKSNRAKMAFDQDRLTEAKVLYGEAEVILRQLAKDFSLTLLYKQNLSKCIFWQGVMTYKQNAEAGKKQMDEAIALLEEELKRRNDKSIAEIRQQYLDLRETVIKSPKD